MPTLSPPLIPPHGFQPHPAQRDAPQDQLGLLWARLPSLLLLYLETTHDSRVGDQ